MVKNKKVYFSLELGCLTVMCLLLIGVFHKQVWLYISTSFSTLQEKSSHPELNVQMISDLGNIMGVYFRPDGERILSRGEWRYDKPTTHEFSDYQLYDKQGKLIADLGEAEWGYITSNGVVLVAMSGSKPNEKLGISVASWKLSFWSWVGELIKEDEGGCSKFPNLIFNSDSSKFVTFRNGGYGCGAKEEYLWSSDGKKIAALSLPNGENIDGVSFSHDGKIITTWARTATFLWDENGNLLSTLSLPDDVHVDTIISFSPNGEQLAISDFDHSDIWTISGQLIISLKDVQVLTYSPDNHYLIGKQYVNGSDDVILFDVQNDFKPKNLITYDKLYGIHFNTEGQRFITFGCTDGLGWESGFFCYGGQATLWDKDGNLITDLRGLAEVTQANFIPGNEKIMIAGCDGIVEYSRSFPIYSCLSQSLRLQDYHGNTMAILRDEIGDFWISPDGETFVTTTARYRGNAKLWRFAP
jgi:hypothetical protein